MQYRGNALRLPVIEESSHVVMRFPRTFDKDRLVSNVFLLLSDGRDILAHHLRTDLHIAHGMVTVGFGVTLPHLDTVGHQFAHCRLVVVVTDYTAGNPRGPCRNRGFVYDQNIGTIALTFSFQLEGQVISRTQSVDACTDNDVLRIRGKSHLKQSPLNSAPTSCLPVKIRPISLDA